MILIRSNKIDATFECIQAHKIEDNILFKEKRFLFSFFSIILLIPFFFVFCCELKIQCILHFRSCDLKTYDLHTVTVSHYYAYMISIKANHRII